MHVSMVTVATLDPGRLPHEAAVLVPMTRSGATRDSPWPVMRDQDASDTVCTRGTVTCQCATNIASAR